MLLGPKGPSLLTENIKDTQRFLQSLLNNIKEIRYLAEDVPFEMIKPPTLDQALRETKKIEMGKKEVTQKLFEKVMGINPSSPQNPNCPVTNVTWYDTLDFCNKLSIMSNLKPCFELLDVEVDDAGMISYAEVRWDTNADGFRLPTVSEWEHCAKAGTQNIWSGTSLASELDKYAWSASNSNWQLRKTGLKLPNEWGFHDMTGNVDEWTLDVCTNRGKMRDWIDLGGGIKMDADSISIGAGALLKGGHYQDSVRTTPIDSSSWCQKDQGQEYTGFRICRNFS